MKVCEVDNELLILYGARHAVIEILENNGKYYMKSLEDGTLCVEYADICNYLTEQIEKKIKSLVN
jgi:hypothetical protein